MRKLLRLAPVAAALYPPANAAGIRIPRQWEWFSSVLSAAKTKTPINNTVDSGTNTTTETLSIDLTTEAPISTTTDTGPETRTAPALPPRQTDCDADQWKFCQKGDRMCQCGLLTESREPVCFTGGNCVDCMNDKECRGNRLSGDNSENIVCVIMPEAEGMKQLCANRGWTSYLNPGGDDFVDGSHRCPLTWYSGWRETIQQTSLSAPHEGSTVDIVLD